MIGWQEEQLHLLSTADNEETLFALLHKRATELGFDFCTYASHAPYPYSQKKTWFLSNYPSAWQLEYAKNNYLHLDPTVKHAECSTLPLVWAAASSDGPPDFWEAARSSGLGVGWVQSHRDISGAIGILGLARAQDTLSNSELTDIGLKLVWLTQIAHIGMMRCMNKKFTQATEALSKREIEVLRWTSEGKTSRDISEILNISERTVNFHINNAMIKLNAPNKTSATVQAAMFGML